MSDTEFGRDWDIARHIEFALSPHAVHNNAWNESAEMVRAHITAQAEEIVQWRAAAHSLAHAWWQQDEDSATDYLLERGWDSHEDFDGPMSMHSLVADVLESPHPAAKEADSE